MHRKGDIVGLNDPVTMAVPACQYSNAATGFKNSGMKDLEKSVNFFWSHLFKQHEP